MADPIIPAAKPDGTAPAAVPTPAPVPAPAPAAAVPVATPAPETPVPAAPVETKTEEKPKGEGTVVPEKYDLKAPEGSTLDAKAIESLSTFAKAHKLSQEQAQALLERDSGNTKAFSEGQKQQQEAVQASWEKSLNEDPEIGGLKKAENAELSMRVIKRFGSKEFIEALTTTKLGNHPELARIFVRIGKAMSEDQLVIPQNQGGGAKKVSPEEALYGPEGVKK